MAEEDGSVALCDLFLLLPPLIIIILCVVLPNKSLAIAAGGSSQPPDARWRKRSPCGLHLAVKAQRSQKRKHFSAKFPDGRFSPYRVSPVRARAERGLLLEQVYSVCVKTLFIFLRRSHAARHSPDPARVLQRSVPALAQRALARSRTHARTRSRFAPAGTYT